jgi:hypothetical protein|tara:strand:+ start:1492 stop:1743 length:252 start_codon:yes stop_codon:yes gene_type:complete
MPVTHGVASSSLVQTAISLGEIQGFFVFKAFIYWRYRAFKNNSVHPESEKNPVKLKRIIHTNPEDTVHNQYIINGDRAILFDL